jgi:hypothetical protein
MKKLIAIALALSATLSSLTSFAEDPPPSDAGEIVVTAAKKAKQKGEVGGNALTFVPIAAITSFRSSFTGTPKPPEEPDTLLWRSFQDVPDPVNNPVAAKALEDLRASQDSVVITAKKKLVTVIESFRKRWPAAYRNLIPVGDLVEVATPRERKALLAAAAEFSGALADSNPAAMDVVVDFYMPGETSEGMGEVAREFAYYVRTGRIRPD